MNRIFEISRNPNNADYHVKIKLQDKWEFYRCDGDKSILLKSGDRSETFVIPNLENKRISFLLKTNGNEIRVSESHIALQGAFNLRDLGGFTTNENRQIKEGKLYRCDDLASITSFDQDYLETLHLSTIVDFRSQGEIDKANDKYFDNVKYQQLSISPGNISANTMEDVMKMTKEEAYLYMCDVYRLLVSDESNLQYKKFFSIVQNQEEKATLYHCSAGKDRTGMATFFILYALGVDRDTIKNDYLSSNNYLKKKYEQYTATYPQLEAMFTVRQEFIDVIIREIEHKYKSIENYLQSVLEIDFDLLKNKYLL